MKARTLEERLAILEAKEAARDAMYRYWRALDYKQWDELRDVFCEDAKAAWGSDWKASGRQGIYDFLHANESRSDLRLSHFGHNPEITVVGEAEATGIFKLEDWVTIGGATVMRGFGQYVMRFVREADDVWRIKSLRLSYDYREERSYFIDDARMTLTPALDK